MRLAIPEDEIAKLKRELIDSKRELIKQLDETIKEAEAVIQADDAKKKAGLLAPHSSEEAADRERVTRLKKEKIDVMEMLVEGTRGIAAPIQQSQQPSPVGPVV